MHPGLYSLVALPHLIPAILPSLTRSLPHSPPTYPHSILPGPLGLESACFRHWHTCPPPAMSCPSPSSHNLSTCWILTHPSRPSSMVTFSLEPFLIPPESYSLLHAPQKGPLAENTYALCSDVSIVGFLFSSPTQNWHFESKDSVSVTFASLVPGS